MTRSITRQPLYPDDDLANVAVAFAVLHFYVLGHRDSYGSCRECHEIIDRVAPEYRSLRSRNTRAARADGSSSTRWNDAVRDLVDPDLFPRLVRTRARSVHPIEAAPGGGFTALAASDVAVIQAAIDEGRSFPAGGLLGQFRCTPKDSTTPHDKGEDTHPQTCSHCVDLAYMVAKAFDRRAAPANTDERPGRLRAIAKHTLYRQNLRNLVCTSPQIVRVDAGMPAKPDADLPIAITRAIQQHEGRVYPTAVYLEMIVAMKWWALEIVNPSFEVDLPLRRIGECLGLSAVMAEQAWQLILNACTAIPAAERLLRTHLLDHLDRRRGCTSLEHARRDQESGEVIETREFRRLQAAHDDVRSIRSDVVERILLDWKLRPSQVTAETVQRALMEVIGEWAVSMRRSGEVPHDVLNALLEGDAQELASLPGVEDLVAEIVDEIRADDDIDDIRADDDEAPPGSAA